MEKRKRGRPRGQTMIGLEWLEVGEHATAKMLKDYTCDQIKTAVDYMNRQARRHGEDHSWSSQINRRKGTSDVWRVS